MALGWSVSSRHLLRTAVQEPSTVVVVVGEFLGTQLKTNFNQCLKDLEENLDVGLS